LSRDLSLPIDWKIRRCLWLSLVILLAVVILASVATIGFDIPALRQAFGFVFLTFIPGILILRILKIHNVGIVESLVYSVGLSLAFVMFIGAFVNFFLPLIGVSKPISLAPIMITLAVFTVLLMVGAYVRDRNFVPTEKPAPGDKLNLPPVLFLIFLFLLTILGVALIDAYQNNLLLLICMLIIAAVVGMAAFGRFIRPEIYPLAIFIIGLCLLYQTTLMSPYLVGSDINTEYRFYQAAIVNGFWDASIFSNIASCLSINILSPVYSLVLNIEGLWMFKAIYPLLFALVPLVLYHVFSQQMSRKKAFLAAFFFVVVPTFSLEMIAMVRQQVAELFLALVILLLVDRRLNPRPKLALIIVFTLGVIVSHYSIGFVGFAYMGLFLPLVFILRSDILARTWAWLRRKGTRFVEKPTINKALSLKALAIVVAIYFTFGFAWYGFTASGKCLGNISKVWTRQMSNVATGLADLLPAPVEQTDVIEPDEVTEPGKLTQPDKIPIFFDFGRRDPLIQAALGLDFARASPQGKVFRILQWITQLFLIAGVIRLIFKSRRLGFTAEYTAISLVSALMLAACIFVPRFANILNTTRWYHIALITLAPFCILGGEAIWQGISSLVRKIRGVAPGTGSTNSKDNQAFLGFIALAVLIPYFLFTSGFVYEVTGHDITDSPDSPYSIALSSYRLDLAGVFYWRDGAAAEWLAQRSDSKTRVYAGDHEIRPLRFYKLQGRFLRLPQKPVRDANFKQGGYIYLTSWDVDREEITYTTDPGLRVHISFYDIRGLADIMANKNKVYDNGGAQVLAPN